MLEYRYWLALQLFFRRCGLISPSNHYDAAFTGQQQLARAAKSSIKPVRELPQCTAFQGQDLSAFPSKIDFVHDTLICD
jgi:hypothetical protein